LIQLLTVNSRLVGTDASNLSALAGAREGTVGATHVNKNTRSISGPSKSGAPGENVTYLKLEKPRFLFLEGSGAVAATLVAATAALAAATAALADAPAALAGASAACAASSTDRPAAGTSAPATGACFSAASAALGDGGGGFHLSWGARPLSLSSSSSPDDEFSEVAGGESPCCSRSRYSLSRCSRRFHRRILFSFLRVARSCSRRCATWAAARAQGIGGSDLEASTITLY
jgi:hypothetical protein